MSLLQSPNQSAWGWSAMFRGVFDVSLRFDIPVGALARFSDACFEGSKALFAELLHLVRPAGMSVDPHALARRPSQQFIDWYAKSFSLDVPESLIDAAQRARQNRAASVEGMSIDGLPVFRNRTRIFADEIRFDLLHRLGAGERAALRNRLTQARNPGIGVDLQEEPARFD